MPEPSARRTNLEPSEWRAPSKDCLCRLRQTGRATPEYRTIPTYGGNAKARDGQRSKVCEGNCSASCTYQTAGPGAPSRAPVMERRGVPGYDTSECCSEEGASAGWDLFTREYIRILPQHPHAPLPAASASIIRRFIHLTFPRRSTLSRASSRMARMGQPPAARLSQPRGASAKKASLSSVRRLLLLLLFAGVLPLLLWLNHLVIVASNNGAASDEAPPQSPHGGASSATAQGGKPIQIAYAISLIKCGDFQSSTSGLLDAATILRHSVHATSIRNPSSGSKYDYKLYAIVHANAKGCSHILSDLGYEVLIKDSPVKIEEIRGEYLQKNVHKEWCCGADEFVKLYAYTIDQHPIVVHTDIDFMYYKPMDDLYDAMLLPHDSAEGRAARKKIEMEYPGKDMPDDIQAYLTRDYHQVVPGRKAAFQAGFIVLKPNQEVFDQYLDTIREGNYVGGFSRENGWGGMGYGGVVGAMAMQGLPAYYYDVIRPNTTVELNGCRYNHMGADVFYDDVPNFIRRYKDLHGKCRRNVEGCEDCRKTELGLIKNIHYTNCRKPWNCAGKSSTNKGDIDPRTTNYEHCMKVARTWHEMRTDLEEKMVNVTNDVGVREGQGGGYMKDVFMGHCKDDGQGGYLPLTASKQVMQQVAAKVWDAGW